MKKKKSGHSRKPHVFKKIAFVSGYMSPYVMGIYSSIEQAVSRTGMNNYELVHYTTLYNEYMANHIMSSLARGRDADCVITLSVSPSQASVSEFKKRRIPLITIEKKVKGAHSILVDNFAGAYKATEHLVNTGRKKIALIRGEIPVLKTGDSAVDVPNERQQGYMAALNKNNITFDQNLVFFVVNHIYEEGYQLFMQMRRNKNLPEAVFCSAGDYVALGFIEAAQRSGVRIPEDIAVIGFDDALMAPIGETALTTVRQPVVGIGMSAFNTAVDALNGKLKSLKSIVFEPELIIRNTA